MEKGNKTSEYIALVICFISSFLLLTGAFGLIIHKLDLSDKNDIKNEILISFILAGLSGLLFICSCVLIIRIRGADVNRSDLTPFGKL